MPTVPPVFRVACLFISLCLVLSGCGTSAPLNPATNYAETGNAGIIVMGVSAQYRIQVSSGTAQPNGWMNDREPMAINAVPVDGYIVAKVPARSNGLN